MFTPYGTTVVRTMPKNIKVAGSRPRLPPYSFVMPQKSKQKKVMGKGGAKEKIKISFKCCSV